LPNDTIISGDEITAAFAEIAGEDLDEIYISYGES
jgi:hypothetical protein